jgi:type VII secretion-associated serine protease mycosin
VRRSSAILYLGVVVGVLAVTPATLLPATAAHAATACPAQLRPPAAQAVTTTPWEQQRYDLSRLDGIADGQGVVVAVVDSGVAADQPQLRGRVLAGQDWVDDGDGRQDCVGHGTAVASIIAAAPSDGSVLRGVAPGVRILPLRVTEQSDKQDAGRSPRRAHALSEALRAAVAAGAAVVNVSMVVTDSPDLQDAVRYALAKGVVVVAAAGNGHDPDSAADPVPYPAAYPGVIGVGSIGADGLRAPHSQVGPYVRLAAPGEGVTAAVQPDGVATFAGTSLAAPFVAGTAALVVQRFGHLSPAQVADRLAATADPAPDGAHSAGYGYGIVNPYRAVTAAWTAPVASGTPARPPIPAAAPAPVPASDASARAYATAGIGVLVLGALLLLASALPRGARRHWRPGA